MRSFDTLFMSLGAIVSNKMRSILTLVGSVAGVASIVAVMRAWPNFSAVSQRSAGSRARAFAIT